MAVFSRLLKVILVLHQPELQEEIWVMLPWIVSAVYLDLKGVLSIIHEKKSLVKHLEYGLESEGFSERSPHRKRLAHYLHLGMFYPGN